MELARASIRNLVPEFETLRHVIKRQKKSIEALTKGGRIAKRLARKIKNCADGEEACETATCPVCVRELRQSFILGASDLIRKIQRNYELPITAFSAILIRERYSVGELFKANLIQINSRLQRQWQRRELPFVCAGIDVSLNEDSRQDPSLYWQIHVWGIVVGLDEKGTKNALKNLYSADESTPKPLFVEECTYLPGALNYAIKATFVRRVSFTDNQGRWKTRKVSLGSSQLRELSTWLGQYPLPIRYLLIGCRRYGDRIELNRNVKKVSKAKIGDH
jgi:hypothetical protein